MQSSSHRSRASIRQITLHRNLQTQQPLPSVQSFIAASGRRTYERDGETEEFYPPQYRTADTLVGHLKFALKHEALHLESSQTRWRPMPRRARPATMQTERWNGR